MARCKRFVVERSATQVVHEVAYINLHTYMYVMYICIWYSGSFLQNSSVFRSASHPWTYEYDVITHTDDVTAPEKLQQTVLPCDAASAASTPVLGQRNAQQQGSEP